MQIVQIAGIGLVATFIIIILKQYKPEYAIYASIAAGILILGGMFVKLTGIIELIETLSSKVRSYESILFDTYKNNRYSVYIRVCI